MKRTCAKQTEQAKQASQAKQAEQAKHAHQTEQPKRARFLVAAFIALVFLGAALLTSSCTKSCPIIPEGTTIGSGSGTSECMVATTLEIMAIKGPSGIGMVKMMESPSSSSTDDLNYSFRLAGSPDEVIAALSSGSVDIAALPTNLAGNFYQKTSGDIRLIAITTYGNLSIVEVGDSVTKLSDLVGKTIHASGQGANPQYILEYLLRDAGLSVENEVTIEWHAEMSEVLALLATGEIEIALLAEPFASTALAKNAHTRIALDLNDLWQKATGYPPVMTAIVARTSYLEAHLSLVDSFLDDLRTSISWVEENPAEAAAMCVTHNIMADASIAEAAIPRAGLTFLEGKDMVPPLTNYFEILMAANPASIGGNIVDDTFFYQR
ncbi:MAG: ABC transporter substrate-binding protein [Eggerthellaceae bacterium]|jgi:NitT/TauT family transport system substrate-binding protein|nr:ABC transporter substrate-binding protein [Eggerthellaceae bacterium]MDR2721980.1 ABC transporter substrate-binding protein [Coriobacteriaceae bacterium]